MKRNILGNEKNQNSLDKNSFMSLRLQFCDQVKWFLIPNYLLTIEMNQVFDFLRNEYTKWQIDSNLACILSCIGQSDILEEMVQNKKMKSTEWEYYKALPKNGIWQKNVVDWKDTFKVTFIGDVIPEDYVKDVSIIKWKNITIQ